MGVLRFILAVSVIAAHTSLILGSSFVGGVIAVKAFYIISGFYMSLILNEKYKDVKGSYSVFITNRFLKIYPMYWLVLVFTVVFYLLNFYLGKNVEANFIINYKEYLNSKYFSLLTFAIFILVNILIIGQDALLFMGINQNGFFFTKNFRTTNPQLYNFLAIPQAWTISLELIFYFIAPFIVRRKMKFVFPLILICFFLKFYFYRNGFKNDPWNYRFFPFELGFFLIGNICYRCYQKMKNYDIGLPKYYWILVSFVFCFTYFFNNIPVFNLIKEYLFYFFIACVIPILFIASKNNKWDNYLGDLSYLLYISHILVLLIINKWYFENESLGIVTLASSLLFSVLSKELIMNKIEVFRQSRIVINKNKI